MEVLTKAEAQFRSLRLSHISYHLSLQLSSDPQFHGQLALQFTYSAAPLQAKSPQKTGLLAGLKAWVGTGQREEVGSVWLDARGVGVKECRFEGKPQGEPVVRVEKGRIWLSGLVDGEYRLLLSYSNTVSDTKSGLMRFEDPQDSEVYLYTHFEPYGANHCCPCFDQPDLKAPFQLTVTAPGDWTVISNSPIETTTSTAETGLSVTVFRPTPLISTYLWAVCAGRFLSFTAPCPFTSAPLGLFCRKSIAYKFPADQLFAWTQKGLEFYQNYLGKEYEFEKYDQVFVPDLDAGAMENVGCVIYNDSSLSSSPTLFQSISLCNTVLHEMAHIWFGNTVTMTWWEDIWLNESFATYLSAKAQFQVQSERRNILLHTFLTYKEAAYDWDQVPGAKAVWRNIENADCKGSAFDMITYVKGSSILEQLEFTIGEAAFREVLQAWIGKYQYSTASIRDFSLLLQSFQLPINPEEWLQSWVQSPGLSTLEVQVQCSNGLITSFSIHQTATPPSPLRQHVLIVSLLDRDWQEYEARKVTVEAKEWTRVEELEGLKEPNFAVLNSREQGHCLVQGNEQIMTRVPISHISSSETRHSLLRILVQLVRSHRLSALQCIQTFSSLLPTEPELGLIYYMTMCAFLMLMAFTRPGNYRKQAASGLFKGLLERLKLESGGKDIEKSTWLLGQIIKFLIHPCDVMEAVGWLDNPIAGMRLRAKDRAEIVRKYACISVNAIDLAVQEVKMRPSKANKYLVEYCKAASPVPFQKDLLYARIPCMASTAPRKEVCVWMAGFSQANQPWLAPYGLRLIQSLPLLLKPPLRSMAEDYISHMAPLYLPPEVALIRLKALMWVLKAVSRKMADRAEEAVFRLEACVLGREKSEEYLRNSE